MSVSVSVSVVNIKNLVKNLPFDSVKEIAENSNLKVKYTDDLYLLHSNESETPIQYEANGLILEKGTNNVICMCDNKMKDFSEDVFDLFSTSFRQVKDNTSIQMEYCEDGTVIRLYNYQGTWYTATTRCIDATKSFWSSERTFDSMFWESCRFNEKFTKEMMLESLDVNYTYIFILLHPDNRIVVQHEEQQVMFIKRINNKTQEYDCYIKMYFSSPVNIIAVNDHKVTYDELNIKYYNSNKRGIIIRLKNEKVVVSYKYDFEKYSQVKNIRGNVPLIRNRYLELLSNPSELELLEVYYQEHNLLFTMINHNLDNLYKNVHKLYISSHVKHEILITEHHPYHHILRQLHGIYKKQNVIITLDEVKKKINSLPIYIINKLLNFV